MFHILGDVAHQIREGGGSAADAVDFTMHGLSEASASMYRSNGFTAHQAHLIENDPRALHNRFHRSGVSLADTLDADAPKDFVVNVLRISQSPDEADRFLRRYCSSLAGKSLTIDGVADTPESVLAEIAVISPHLSTTECDCTFG